MNTNKIVIVGGGSAGWMTASTLIKSFPEKDIVLIESKNHPIIGVGESTLGGIKRWTKYIGINESMFFKETDASIKMSIKFTDFYKKGAGAFHYPFGSSIQYQERNPIVDWHLKKYFYPSTPISDFTDCLFPSSFLFKKNKFSKNLNFKFDNFDPEISSAYHFDAIKFGQWLKNNICLPLGVKHILADVVSAKTSENGIDALILEDGSEISSDLFIDCTGFKSLLIGKFLEETFIPYSHILPNNKAWATQIPYDNKIIELEGYTNSTAIENGWCWNIPLWSRLGSGYVYSDKYVSDEEALKQFKKYLSSQYMTVPKNKETIENLSFKNINMKVGIHKRTFVKNVVAIGLSAGFIEPLESNGLFSVHEFLFKLVDILQRGNISEFDRDMYNISVKDLFDNFAKFVSLHYALSHRDDTDYWRDVNKRSYQDSYGDPYFPYYGRSDAFYNLTQRFMEEWSFPNNNAGIPYIATGMNLFLFNKNRIDHIESITKKSLKKELEEIVLFWEERKKRWREESYKSETLINYLKNNYYE